MKSRTRVKSGWHGSLLTSKRIDVRSADPSVHREKVEMAHIFSADALAPV